MSEHVRDRLSAYLDRELAPADDDAVVAHLRGCEACRSHLAALTSVDEVARALPVEAPAGYFDTLPGRVRARLDAASVERAADARERERKRFPARERVGGPTRSFKPAARRPLGLPAWTWAVAAALLLAVVTPLTMREQRAPLATPTPPKSLAIPAAPAALPMTLATPPMTRTGEDLTGGGAAPAPAAAREAARKDDEGWKARDEMVPAARPEKLNREAVGGLQAEARSAEMESTAAARSPAPRAPAATAPAAPKRQRVPGPGGPYAQAQSPSQAQAQVQRPPEQAADDVAVGTMAEELTVADGREGARDKAEGAPSLAKGTREQDEQGLRASGAVANYALAADEVEYSRLAAPATQTVGALRARREAWRSFVVRYPRSAWADEARVRVIEAGIAAWRLGRDSADLGQARVDATSYLSRPDAAQAARVRALLETVEGRY